MKKRFILWLLRKLHQWNGDYFDALEYPKFYACIIGREAVAEVSANRNLIRARVIEENAKGTFNVRLVTYQACKAERLSTDFDPVETEIAAIRKIRKSFFDKG